MLKIKDETVTMTRFGSTSSKIVFDTNTPMTSLYKTPYGDFDMKVTTHKLEANIDPKKPAGCLEISYQMVLEELSSSHNHLVIRIKSWSI